MPTPHSKTVCVNESQGGICREGKISDLSQADTSYYQVHKIQPITKRHILLVDFAITTHKATEICQMSCKNQSRISARVSDDTSSLAHVSDDTSRPIKLWHVSPIKLGHVSLTHPKTPINRSLPETFRGTRIQKWKSSAKIKPQSLQELQPQNRRTFEAESSRSSA